MKFLDKFLKIGIKETVQTIGSAIDDLSTTQEEKLILKKKIAGIVLEKMTEIAQVKSEVIQTEINGNWLQRSWRPLIMLAFAAIVIYNKFIGFILNLPVAPLEGEFWAMLELGLGGYVIGRSLEKVSEKIDMGSIKIPRKKQNK